MIDTKDNVLKEGFKENMAKAELRVVSDRVSESFCTVLKKTREKKGLSIREVADTLRLTRSIVSALEEQRYDSLPADIYTVGYIRSYAALLELNPEGLVKDFKQSKELLELNCRDREIRDKQIKRELQQTEEPTFEKLAHTFGKLLVEIKQNYFKHTILALCALVAGLIFVVQFYNENNEEVLRDIDKVKVLSADGSVHVSDLQSDIATEQVINKDEQTLNEDGVKMLFSDTTWVTIRDRDRNLIHQSRKQKGNQLKISGLPPFYIKLSNASAVNLFLNDLQVDFSAQVTDDDQLLEFMLTP